MFLTQRDCTVSEDTFLLVFFSFCFLLFSEKLILAWKNMSAIYNTSFSFSGTFAFFEGAACTT